MTTLDAPVAMLGGTFDPVHYGHLRLASEVRDALALPEVRLVPAGDPPHRGAPDASAADRIAMLELAIREFPGLTIDTRETRRQGKSYTVLTLEELRSERPRSPLLLLLGADAFRGLAGWHQWRRLFDLAHLVVAPRPGTAVAADLPPELEREWRARHTGDRTTLRSCLAGSIYAQPISAQPISSTAIRAALRSRSRGKPDGSRDLAGLLPAAVLAYIGSRHLYLPPANAPVEAAENRRRGT
ncbi:MAG TPA: nicotinate-nucleotide adenylyltransferase [Casimicrobiaceae bacterium]|nr:nicotinate-nucleotide adenylyltransferase [Casimicrobiaceae bacterium]